MSNLAWSTKRAEVLKYTALNLNKQIDGYEVWDEAAIQDRGEALFKTFAAIWPHPSA